MQQGAALTRFDPIADVYEDWFTTRLGAFVESRERDLLLRLLRPQPGERILEVGSGTGHFARLIGRSGAYCFGIEPSAEMLRVATSLADGNVAYVRGKGETLPFASGSFDAALCMTTLEFAHDPEAMVSEAVRVTQTDGRLVFGVLNADGPWARARHEEGGLWDQAHFFHAREIEALLSPYGAIRTEYAVHVPPHAEGWPRSLMALSDALLKRLSPGNGALIGVQVRLRR